MKPFKLVIITMRGLFLFKSMWMFVCGYSLVTLTSLMLLARGGEWMERGIFDLIVNVGGTHGSMNHLMFIIVAIPVIMTVLNHVTEKNEETKYVLTLGSRFRIWHVHVISAISLSAILTCLMMFISFLIGGILVSLNNTWITPTGTISEGLNNNLQFQSIISNLATYKIILSLFITKFFGFLMISFCVLFLKQIVKNAALIMVILIAIAGLDQSGFLHFSLYTWKATLSINNWLDPMLTVYNSIYLIVISLVLYGITGLLFERKDFLS